MAIVTLHDIHVAFGMEVVLDKLNLELHAGEKVGIACMMIKSPNSMLNPMTYATTA